MNYFDNRRSVVTTLITVNIAVFLATYLIPDLVRYLAVYPGGLSQGLFWTPVTYMFVHGGFMHLLFNMIFLIFAASSVESRMGSREFLIFYLTTGALAGLFSVFAYRNLGYNIPIVGASGALYGSLLAFATYFPRVRLLVFYILPMRAPYALLVFAGLDIFMHMRGRVGIAHLTHLSGLAFGYLYFVIRLRMNPIHEMRDKR